jgi:hypothetical protein
MTGWRSTVAVNDSRLGAILVLPQQAQRMNDRFNANHTAI